jgi:PIF1-like helicase/Helix-turn-helix domain
MNALTNDQLSFAGDFVNSTSSHIFLTGKAGTGKTTFLHSLQANTYKRFAIAAPTGIAALNAGGVTIHSLFQLPLGTFIPDNSPSGEFSRENEVYTQYSLTRKHPISSAKKQILQSLDLLIIDEVSMLRADVLDAIDFRLKSARRNFRQSFGGVQLLLIGDLYQLPPVVKDHEWNYLRRYYHTAHFFESRSLQSEGFTFIELDKIFRQSDETFIHLLNNLRNNITTQEDLQLLNSYVRSEAQIEELDNVVTITTHNYRADDLNKRALDAIPLRIYKFKAEIEGEFPSNIFPLLESLELKIGAQVMFMKNDPSPANKFYNGKLARVVSLSSEEIEVEMLGSGERMIVPQLEWQNKKYSIDPTSRELEEDVTGTFSQYPLKLAWAITVHKSQGLTFDKAIIDVASAFAPGQVYVALSRLRSLEGLVLRTRIDFNSISTDQDVVKFSSKKDMQGELNILLEKKQLHFIHQIISGTFDFSALEKQVEYVLRNSFAGDEPEISDVSFQPELKTIYSDLQKEKPNTEKFRRQLLSLLNAEDKLQLADRLRKGSEYYKIFLEGKLKLLLSHIQEVSKLKRQKSYLNDLSETDQLLNRNLEEIERAEALISSIISKKDWKEILDIKERRAAERQKLFDEAAKESGDKTPTVRIKKGKRKKNIDPNKLSSVDETVQLFNTGKTLDEIAAERQLAKGTIETHFSQAIGQKKIDILKLLDAEEVEMISKALGTTKEGLSGVHNFFESRFSYSQIRYVQSMLLADKPKEKEDITD